VGRGLSRRKDAKEFEAKARSIIEQDEGPLMTEEDEDEGSDLQEESVDFGPTVTEGSLDDIIGRIGEGPKTESELAEEDDYYDDVGSDYDGKASLESSSAHGASAISASDSLVEDYAAPAKAEKGTANVQSESGQMADQEMSTDEAEDEDLQGHDAQDVAGEDSDKSGGRSDNDRSSQAHDDNDGEGRASAGAALSRASASSCIADGNEFLERRKLEQEREKEGSGAENKYTGGPTRVYSGLQDGRPIKLWEGEPPRGIPLPEYEPLYGGPPLRAGEHAGEGGAGEGGDGCSRVEFDECEIPLAAGEDGFTAAAAAAEGTSDGDDADQTERNLR
jgi:hypothetical protein